MRTYELMFVVDPRASDDDVAGIAGEYPQIRAHRGAKVTKTEIWGRRKLAYPIQKVNEGKYVVVFFCAPDGGTPISDIERRMEQNDKVLRFLTVRTDEDLKRAGRPLPLEVEETPAAVVAAAAEPAASEKAPAKASELAPEPAPEPAPAPEPVAEPAAETESAAAPAAAEEGT
jgi:small subunit ribosomal protein S6